MTISHGKRLIRRPKPQLTAHPEWTRLCAEVNLPEPDPATWRQQAISVCTQLRDQYLRYPGISRAAFAVAASNLDTLRVSEGMLAILLAGSVDPQTRPGRPTRCLSASTPTASKSPWWTNNSPNDQNGCVVSRAELLRRFAALPGTFLLTRRYAAELTGGTGHDRFDFTIGLIIDGLAHRQGRGEWTAMSAGETGSSPIPGKAGSQFVPAIDDGCGSFRVMRC